LDPAKFHVLRGRDVLALYFPFLQVIPELSPGLTEHGEPYSV